jgi:ComF family protein
MGFLDVVLPPVCASCGGSGWPLCGACTDEVGVVTPPWCERCGRPWEEPFRSCVDCPPPAVDRARSPFLYEGALARAIRGMKFSGWHALGPHLAGGMAEVAGDVLPADAVAWVSLSGRRRSRRGFDQAEVIARALAMRLDLPVVPLLRRVRETGAQARRSGVDRQRALGDAFRAVDEAPRTVLLVDDVLTTGATAAACAETLKRAGAATVRLLTAARSLGGPVPARCRGSGRRGTGPAPRVP